MTKEYYSQILADQTTTLKESQIGYDELEDLIQRKLKHITGLLKLPNLAGDLAQQVAALNKNQSLFEAAAKKVGQDYENIAPFIAQVNDAMATLNLLSSTTLELQSAIKDNQRRLDDTQDLIDELKTQLANWKNQPMKPEIAPEIAPEITIQPNVNLPTVNAKFTVKILPDGSVKTFDEFGNEIAPK